MGAEVTSEGIQAGNCAGLRDAPKHKFETLEHSPVGEIRSNPPQVRSIVKLQETKDKMKNFRNDKRKNNYLQNSAPPADFFMEAQGNE